MRFDFFIEGVFNCISKVQRVDNSGAENIAPHKGKIDSLKGVIQSCEYILVTQYTHTHDSRRIKVDRSWRISDRLICKCIDLSMKQIRHLSLFISSCAGYIKVGKWLPCHY